MRAKDIEVGEEYLATASTDNRYESDRVRVRVVEAPVEGKAYGFSRRTYSTGRMDSALVEALDKKTGKPLDEGRLYRLRATKAGDGYVIRLATIKMPWSEWVEEQKRREEAERKRDEEFNTLLAERERKFEEIRRYFADLDFSKSGGSTYRVWDRVTIYVDELHDWVVHQKQVELEAKGLEQ